MTSQTSSTPNYTMGFSPEIMAIIRRFTAANHAAYLLPYIRPGMRVLDFGCGPGTISVSLAAAAAPAEMHGIDMEESQVELARAVAQAENLDNALFQVGDVTDLPFEDEYFDVAHCHNVLMHVPDTMAALNEVKRVLKPGGIIGCSEMICESSFTYPDYGVLRRAWDIFEELLSNDDGHPQMGKAMKTRIMDAGFENLTMNAMFDVFNTPAEIEFIYTAIGQWFLAPEITQRAIDYGVATPGLIRNITASYERWREDPNALLAVAYGEAVANKPLP